MQPSRRALLAGMAGAAALAALPVRARDTGFYLGARWDETRKRGFAGAFDDAGNRIFDLDLPDRGHGLALRPGAAQAVVLGRRPGSYAAVIDLGASRVARLVSAATDRRFCGHGVFDPAGDLLYATELVYSTGDGVVGVYDARRDYRRIGEFPSGGLDPHDIRWMADGRLVVANGGILTDPAAPGVKLNLHEMDSNLTRLDPASGTVVRQGTLPPALARLSLRHLALLRGDHVAVVMQYEGPSTDSVPLAALWDGAGALDLIDVAQGDLRRLRQYCGSAAASVDGRLLAFSSPRGHVALVWNSITRQTVGAIELADGCGIAADATGGFVLTGGLGGARHWRAGGAQDVVAGYVQSAQWDNHLIRA